MVPDEKCPGAAARKMEANNIRPSSTSALVFIGDVSVPMFRVGAATAGRLAIARPAWRLGSEGQGHAALPGDVVLRPVNAIAVERVDEVASFRAQAETLQPVLHAEAEIPCGLGPRAVGSELMDGNAAATAHRVRTQGARARLHGIPNHDAGVVGELVEPAAAGDARAADAVLRPACAGAHAQVPMQPVRGVHGRRPAGLPIGGAPFVQLGAAGDTT